MDVFFNDKLDCGYHVGLPAFHIDTPIDAPPEVIFRFTLPCKHAETWKATEHVSCTARIHRVVETRGRKQQVLEPTRRTHTHSLTSLCQSRCHFILGGVDVAGCPPALSPQSGQGLHQHLTGGEGLTELGQKEQRPQFMHICSHSQRSAP